MSFKCLAIGISQVRPVDGIEVEFPHLDGAIGAAESIGSWASWAGADQVRVLTDRDGPISDQDLAAAVDALLPHGSRTEHLVLAFAGHGLTGLNDDITYWLLSDSLEAGYQIFVEDLRRQIEAYGVHKLSIFSDACRAIANTGALRGLSSRPGISRRHAPRLPGFALARYNACQDTEKAFMIKAADQAEPGKCLFSGVLTEALCGDIAGCFDRDAIDAMSLGVGLFPAVCERAKQYDLSLTPSGNTGYARIVYLEKGGTRSGTKPALAPWPDLSPRASVERDPRRIDAGELLEALRSDRARQDAILGPEFGVDHPDIDSTRPLPRLPAAARPVVADLAETRQRLKRTRPGAEDEGALQQRLAESLRTLESMVADQSRRREAARISAAARRLEAVAASAEVGLIVGGGVRQVWTDRAGIEVARRSRGNAQFAVRHDLMGRQILVEFDDGQFAPVVLYPGLQCLVLGDSAGVHALNYRPAFGHDESTTLTSRIVSELALGSVNAAALDRLATDLRHYKHINPVFGAIAAYCYEVTGDLDSTRRMAYFYAMNGQPAPYDVAYMAMLENDGVKARVPKVEADTQRRARGLPMWLVGATGAAEVKIGGRCPWLRQGWDFLSAPEDVERAMAGALADLRPHLRASAFTTLDAAGGRELADRWGLKPCL